MSRFQVRAALNCAMYFCQMLAGRGYENPSAKISDRQESAILRHLLDANLPVALGVADRMAVWVCHKDPNIERSSFKELFILRRAAAQNLGLPTAGLDKKLKHLLQSTNTNC